MPPNGDENVQKTTETTETTTVEEPKLSDPAEDKRVDLHPPVTETTTTETTETTTDIGVGEHDPSGKPTSASPPQGTGGATPPHDQAPTTHSSGTPHSHT